jgi:hypothetical protein
LIGKIDLLHLHVDPLRIIILHLIDPIDMIYGLTQIPRDSADQPQTIEIPSYPEIDMDISRLEWIAPTSDLDVI